MKKVKISLLALMCIINSILSASCWDYREVDQVAIVSGVAIDKGTNGQYQITTETIAMSGGRETEITSKTVTIEGKTIFDAIRNVISVSGKKLYWSHAKVVILSKEIARDGVGKVLDFFNRDAELREDINILISGESSAKEIFTGQKTTEDIKAIVLDEMLTNQESLSKAPISNMLEYDIEAKTKGLSTILPTVRLKKVDGNMAPQIVGAAIIKNEKLVGFLNGEETKDLMFIRNEVKGGILVEELKGNGKPTIISLEIFNNKTKVKPVVKGKDITMNIDIETTVAIDEVIGTVNILDAEGLIKLEHSTANSLKKRIESLIKKMQSQYAADIFGFGAKLQQEEIQTWNQIGNNWMKYIRI